MLIYFAAPLFCKAEQTFNMNLTEKLEELGFTVFLPQRDGVGISKILHSERKIEELRESIFAIDRGKVLEADIFLFVLDGRVPDDGGCVELGIAYAQKYLLKRDKLIIGLHTDVRGAYAFLDAKLNPLILGSCDDIAEDENALIALLEKYEQTKQVVSEPI